MPLWLRYSSCSAVHASRPRMLVSRLLCTDSFARDCSLRDRTDCWRLVLEPRVGKAYHLDSDSGGGDQERIGVCNLPST